MKVILTLFLVLSLITPLFSQANAVWSSQDKKLDVPTRGVQLIWDSPDESDVSAVMIYRRAMDHRINKDLTNVPWQPLVRLSPGVWYWKDKSAQVSVTYQYKIMFINTSGEESDPVIISTTVLNEKPPDPPSGFRINGFDPMPPN